jgi:hypothetical protein
VLLVRGVSESIQQIVKSSNAPAVLRRAGQLANGQEACPTG